MDERTNRYHVSLWVRPGQGLLSFLRDEVRSVPNDKSLREAKTQKWEYKVRAAKMTAAQTGSRRRRVKIKKRRG